jgi:hypothetical protein
MPGMDDLDGTLDPPYPPCDHEPRLANRDGSLWPCAYLDCPANSGVHTVEVGSSRHLPVKLVFIAVQRGPVWLWELDA